jgi:hypothetical protein
VPGRPADQGRGWTALATPARIVAGVTPGQRVLPSPIGASAFPRLATSACLHRHQGDEREREPVEHQHGGPVGEPQAEQPVVQVARYRAGQTQQPAYASWRGGTTATRSSASGGACRGQPYAGRRRGGRTLLHRDGRGGRGAGPRRDGRALRDRSRGSPDPAARPRDAGKIRDAGGVGRKGHQPVLGSVPRPGRDGSAQLAHAVSPRVLPHASRPALRLAVPAPSLRTRPTSSPTSSARRPTAVARRSFSSRDASRRTRPPSPTWTAPITAAGRSSAWTPGKPRSRSSR